MSATALYWVQLQHAIRLRIAELAGVFSEGITANAAVTDPASGSEPPEPSTVFRLAQEEAAENWLSAMGAACIVQLMAEAQSVWEHPNWRFLYAISKEEIAPRLEELLHASFGITQKDLGLIKRWGDGRGGGAGFVLERSTASIARAFKFARAKKRAVNQILDQLLGVSRKLAFGEPSKPKFGVPAAQIKNTPAPEAQPVPTPSVSTSAKPSEPEREEHPLIPQGPEIEKDGPTSQSGQTQVIESGWAKTEADATEQSQTAAISNSDKPKRPSTILRKVASQKLIRFDRFGDRISVEPGFTGQQLLNTYDMFAKILGKVRAYVLEKQKKPVRIVELKKAFRSTELSQFSNDEQVKEWVKDFRGGATAKNIALVHLERMTGLDRSTIKSRLGRARGLKKGKK